MKTVDVGGSLTACAPNACTLDAAAQGARQSAIAQLNASALTACRRTDLTLELIYRSDVRAQVLHMVAAEQACCGFLNFEIFEDLGEVRVVIRADAGAQVAASALFDLMASASPQGRMCGCSGGDVR